MSSASIFRRPTGGSNSPTITSGASGSGSGSAGYPAAVNTTGSSRSGTLTAALGYLTLWPAGVAQPLVSTLNACTGTVTANAAIVQAGSSGAVNVFVTHDSDLVLDVNGYFAPAGPGGLSFYAVSPCRASDTRQANGSLGGPSLAAGETRVVPVASSACGVPASAQAYSLNATAVPAKALGYLSLWPAGGSVPLVSTLNSYDGTVVSNAAIVPAGTNAAIAAYVSDAADLILDLNGYFAP